MGRIWQKLLKVLVSTRTALGLMILLGISTVYGVIVSQAFFASAWFRIVGSLLFLNTASCTVRQYVRSWRLWRIVGKRTIAQIVYPEKRRFVVSGSIDFKKAIAGVASLLRLRGYVVTNEPIFETAQSYDVLLNGHRGRFGYWGSPIFHTALLLVMIGAMLSSVGRTTEDLILNEESSTILKSGAISLSAPESITLSRVKMDFDPQGQMREWTAQVEVARGKRLREQVITSEREYEDGSMTMSIQANGYTPGFLIRQNGKVVARVRLLLKSIPLSDGYLYQGKYLLPGNNPDQQNLIINFWPNFVWKGQLPSSRGDAPLHPTVSLAVEEQSPQSQVQVIGVGENTQIESWNVTFDHYKPWLMLKVVRDPGYLFIVFGSFLAIAGLVSLFLWTPKEVLIRINLNSNQVILDITGGSYRFRKTMQLEIEAITKQLHDALSNLA